MGSVVDKSWLGSYLWIFSTAGLTEINGAETGKHSRNRVLYAVVFIQTSVSLVPCQITSDGPYVSIASIKEHGRDLGFRQTAMLKYSISSLALMPMVRCSSRATVSELEKFLPIDGMYDVHIRGSPRSDGSKQPTASVPRTACTA